jgi:hypothetical protein
MIEDFGDKEFFALGEGGSNFGRVDPDAIA